jgi:8-oxo-dGTP pyrophosphatase MutT (NUDIX family)
MFQDAALRAVYEELGQLIARPALQGEALPSAGGWGRLARHRLAPEREALTYLGRALDPSEAETRRHLRVFAAPLSKVSNSIKRRGRADRIVWMTPDNAATALADASLAPFLDLALSALGGRPRPLRVTFRAGQRVETRL